MPISKINTTSITDNSVTAGKIVAGAVDADIAAGSIDTAQIADDAVTSAKLDTNITIDGTLDVDGSEITVGTSGSRFAENNLNFKAGGASYIDHSTVGQNINFRMSNSSSLDTTAMTLQPTQLYVSGNLGVGTSTPDTKVQIKGSVNSAQLILGGTDGRGLKISTFNQGGQNDGTAIYDAQDNESSAINSHHVFKNGGTETIRITKDGLTFGGDTAAANALDDYEEGDFVPTITTSGGTTTYVSQKGAYTRIGRVCHIMVNLVASNNSNVTLYNLNLPFTAGHVSSGTSWYPTIAIGNFYNVNLTGGGTMLGAYTINGQAAARLHSCGNNTNQLAPSCTANTNFEVRFEGSFIIQ